MEKNSTDKRMTACTICPPLLPRALPSMACAQWPLCAAIRGNRRREWRGVTERSEIYREKGTENMSSGNCVKLYLRFFPVCDTGELSALGLLSSPYNYHQFPYNNPISVTS